MIIMGRPPKYPVDDLEKAIADYFKKKADEKKARNKKLIYMSIYDLCSFLDISRQTWYNYKNKPEYLDLIKRTEAKIFSNWVEQLFYPGRNSTGAIFYLKNAAGWADKLQHQHQHKLSGQVEHIQKLDEIDPDKLSQLSAALKELQEPGEVIDL